tara:strand:+ start:123 stop:851 length:729 start_codon:yes stop_codon:yes gene_type:complete
MKFNFFLIFLLTACVANNLPDSKRSSYSSNGFAYVYSDSDYKNKITSKKFENSELLIGHSILKTGTIVKILNPINNKFVKLKIKKKTKYPDFYTVLITQKTANVLDLNLDVPYVEIYELKKNKSFIAGKAETFNEERNVHNKAPVTSVKIDNISTNKSKKIKKINKFSIVIANFYNKKNAILLKNKLTQELTNFGNKNLSIINKGINNFELVSGTYNTVNSLKNDYIVLKKYGFEELDIKIK